jgi:hypothetical protein
VTDLEQRAIRALRGVSMPEEVWHWRRAEYLYFRLQVFPNAKLVETQIADLWYLCWRYRRQITDQEIVARADYIVNGAMQLAYERNPPKGER